MSTCRPGHVGSAARADKGTPDLFFVVSAIKACYGILPCWDEEWKKEQEEHIEEDEEVPECYGNSGTVGSLDNGMALPNIKRPRIQSQTGRRELTAIDTEYKRLYSELRDSALADIKTFVRKHVEGLSTPSASYDFMNLYGMCSFDPPNVARVAFNKGGPACCAFTKLSCPEDDTNSNSHRLISVSGILNPLISSRIKHGELELTHCGESDYHRATEEFARIDSRSKMRVPKVYKGDLGSTVGSMANRFIFTIREDLHAMGCAYRQMIVTVELLHLNLLHFIYS